MGAPVPLFRQGPGLPCVLHFPLANAWHGHTHVLKKDLWVEDRAPRAGQGMPPGALCGRRAPWRKEADSTRSMFCSRTH